VLFLFSAKDPKQRRVFRSQVRIKKDSKDEHKENREWLWLMFVCLISLSTRAGKVTSGQVLSSKGGKSGAK
jgi:hypothetical protein